MKRLILLALVVAALPSPALAQKIFLNPSDQYSNAVSGGGNEAQFANDNANRAASKIGAAGFATRVVEGLSAAVDSANAWTADIYISVHTNAGGGHGTETWYYTGSGTGAALAEDVQDGLLERFNVGNRGLKSTTEFYVLRNTSMPAVLTEIIFHDCSSGHSFPIGSMSEADFLRDGNGRGLMSDGIADGACAYYGASCPVPSCQPSPESCDGQDNDCDGNADNGDPGGGGGCNTGASGPCSAGVLHCRGGSIVCEQTGQPSGESCDGQDNDCDGTADNGDPGGGGGCSTGLPGPCGAGVQHCRGGSVVCEQTGSASGEVCDGQDNDCDGTADNGDPGSGEPCETGLPGVCASGTRHCQGGELVCVASREASVETCDGNDNDCDGETDEDCVVDAGLPEEDAGTVEDDGGVVPGADGGLADGGWIWPNDVGAVTAGGCGCNSSGGGPLLPAMLALLGLFCRRRGNRRVAVGRSCRGSARD